MTTDAQSRRGEGVRTLTAAEMSGSRGSNGEGVILPTVGYRNPGPTANLRGVEGNTNRVDQNGNSGDPIIEPTPGQVYSDPVQFPDSSGLTAITGPDGKPWLGVDAASRNSVPYVLPPDSFSAMGEFYPANGRGSDGES
jgi:hypothetical protein